MKVERPKVVSSFPSEPIEISDDKVEDTDTSTATSVLHENPLLPRQEIRKDGEENSRRINQKQSSYGSEELYTGEEDRARLAALDEFSRESELARRHELLVRRRQREELFQGASLLDRDKLSQKVGSFSDGRGEGEAMSRRSRSFVFSSLSPVVEDDDPSTSPRSVTGGAPHALPRRGQRQRKESVSPFPHVIGQRQSPCVNQEQPSSPAQSSLFGSSSPFDNDEEGTVTLTGGEELLRTPNPEGRRERESASLRRMRNEEAELVGRLARIAEMREREERREKEREEEERRKKERVEIRRKREEDRVRAAQERQEELRARRARA